MSREPYDPQQEQIAALWAIADALKSLVDFLREPYIDEAVAVPADVVEDEIRRIAEENT